MSTPTVSDSPKPATVTIARALPASASRIWTMCTEPRELARWQTDRARGRAAVGEHLLLSWPTLGIAAEIAVLELEPERRLVLKHGSTDVTFTVHDGALEITHSLLPDDETAEGVASSWRLSLAVLAHYLEHHDGKDRRVTWHVGEAATTAAAAHVYFTDAGALATWLTRSGAVGAAGAEVELELAWLAAGGRGSARLSGRVLANSSGRDLALSWREQNQSVVALRTLPGADAEQRVLALSWSRWGAPAARVNRSEALLDDQLAAAVGRLQRLLGAAVSA